MYYKGYCYDIEVYPNYFCIGFKSYQTKVYKRFEIYKSNTTEVNQLQELIDFAKYCSKNRDIWWIGFNILNYDYPVIHPILNQCIKYHRNDKDNFLNYTTEDLLSLIYQESCRIIDEAFTKTFGAKSNKIYVNRHLVTNIDLFTIWHFDNKSKMTSLKSLEIAMGMDNVEESPIPFNQPLTDADIPLVRLYNDNDLDATELLFDITIGNTDNPIYKGQDKMKLRIESGEKYGLNLMCNNDVSIGKEIVLNVLGKKLGLDKKDFHPTWYREIKVRELLFPVSFNSKEMNIVNTFYKDMIVHPLEKT